MDTYITARTRRIAADYDRDRPALPPSISVEQYAAWWIEVKGEEYKAQYEAQGQAA